MQQRFRAAAVLQARDRVVLLRRKSGRDRNPPQERRRQREDQIVGLQRADLPPVFDAGAHAAPAMRDRHQLGIQMNPVTERTGDAFRQPIVAAFDPQAAHARRFVLRELIDERQQ